MKKAKAYVLVMMAALMWSLQGVLGKAAQWNTFSLVGVRAVFACMVLGAARRSYRLPMERKNWIAGAFVALTALLFLAANKLTSAANAIILQYTMPLFVLLIWMIVYGKRPERYELVFAFCTLTGVILCVSGKVGSGSMVGNLLALLSAITYAGVFSAGKLLEADVLDYSYVGNMLCVLFCLAIPFDGSFRFDWLNLSCTAAMGITVGVGYFLFAKGMQSGILPIEAAILSNLEPVANPIWVFFALGEKPGTLSVVGFVVVLLSVTVYSLLKNRGASAGIE